MDQPHESNLTVLGKVWHRGEKLFGMRQPDRLSHLYLIGKTGTGKSTLIETISRQDIRCGRATILLDPHGDLAAQVASSVPPGRREDLTYLNPAREQGRLGFNPLADVSPEKRPLAASNLLEVFKKIWSHSWGPRLEYILRHALRALLAQPEPSLVEMTRLFQDDQYRKRAAKRVADPVVREFWLEEFDNYSSRFRSSAVSPIQNKVGAFTTNPILREILTASQNDFQIRDIMNNNQILIANLAKGQIGQENASLLGALLLARIGTAGLERAELSARERNPVFVYLDEFHTFAPYNFSSLLSELRKYGVGLVLAHQFISQIPKRLREGILGNVGSIICFRIGPKDARILGREFSPTVEPEDLSNLPNHHIYAKLMIEGKASKPFWAVTVKPSQVPGLQP